MVTEKIAKEQIFRLKRLENFPNGQDEIALRADMVKALRLARDDAHAVQIVDDWLTESIKSPTIAELRKLAMHRDEPQEAESPFRRGEKPFDGNWMVSDMAPELLAKWKHLAQNAQSKDARDIAARIVADYEREHEKAAK